MTKPVRLGYPMRYWNHMRNIGDAINPFILEHVSGVTPFFCMNHLEEHVLAIGSILFMATSGSHIWGAGIMNPAQSLISIDPEKIHAVRGQYTLDLLQRHFPGLGPIPLGDPGIFVSELPEVREHLDEDMADRNIVIFPHHRFRYHEYFAALERNPNVVVVNPASDRLDVIRTILRSQLVISQSLHGLIFAEALGRPSTWISHTRDPAWLFKFKDWFSTTHRPDTQPRIFGTPLSVLIRDARLAGIAIDRGALRQALPKLRPVERQSSITYRQNRLRSPYVFVIQDTFYRVPRFFADEIIVTNKFNNNALRLCLRRYQENIDENFSCLIIFDEALFQTAPTGTWAELHDILDNNHDINSACLLPRSFHTGIAAPEASVSPRSILTVESWNSSQSWEGVLLLRSAHYFGAQTGVVSVFLP